MCLCACVWERILNTMFACVTLERAECYISSNLILQPLKHPLSLTVCTSIRSPVGCMARASSYRPLASSRWPRSSARRPRCSSTEWELGKSELASAIQNWASLSRLSAMNSSPAGWHGERSKERRWKGQERKRGGGGKEKGQNDRGGKTIKERKWWSKDGEPEKEKEENKSINALSNPVTVTVMNFAVSSAASCKNNICAVLKYYTQPHTHKHTRKPWKWESERCSGWKSWSCCLIWPSHIKAACLLSLLLGRWGQTPHTNVYTHKVRITPTSTLLSNKTSKIRADHRTCPLSWSRPMCGPDASARPVNHLRERTLGHRQRNPEKETLQL